MRVVEYIEKVQDELERLKAKYCSDCQEFTCDWCMKELYSDDERVAERFVDL